MGDIIGFSIIIKHLLKGHKAKNTRHNLAKRILTYNCLDSRIYIRGETRFWPKMGSIRAVIKNQL